MTRYIEVELEDGWHPFNVEDPRCPVCGDKIFGITNARFDRWVGNIEYGSINIYCYRDSILKFRYRGERGALVPETADDLCLEDDPEMEDDRTPEPDSRICELCGDVIRREPDVISPRWCEKCGWPFDREEQRRLVEHGPDPESPYRLTDSLLVERILQSAAMTFELDWRSMRALILRWAERQRDLPE